MRKHRQKQLDEVYDLFAPPDPDKPQPVDLKVRLPKDRDEKRKRRRVEEKRVHPGRYGYDND